MAGTALLVDTDILIDYLRGIRPARDLIDSDRVEISRIGNNARIRVESYFSLATMCSKTIEVYKELLKYPT